MVRYMLKRHVCLVYVSLNSNVLKTRVGNLGIEYEFNIIQSSQPGTVLPLSLEKKPSSIQIDQHVEEIVNSLKAVPEYDLKRITALFVLTIFVRLIQ